VLSQKVVVIAVGSLRSARALKKAAEISEKEIGFEQLKSPDRIGSPKDGMSRGIYDCPSRVYSDRFYFNETKRYSSRFVSPIEELLEPCKNVSRQMNSPRCGASERRTIIEAFKKPTIEDLFTSHL
jgi:hypothetical protein